jgi:hypothetical protein
MNEITKRELLLLALHLLNVTFMGPYFVYWFFDWSYILRGSFSMNTIGSFLTMPLYIAKGYLYFFPITLFPALFSFIAFAIFTIKNWKYAYIPTGIGVGLLLCLVFGRDAVWTAGILFSSAVVACLSQVLFMEFGRIEPVAGGNAAR